MFLIAGLVLAVDQLTKLIILLKLDEDRVVPVIENVLDINIVRNTGAAFGIFKNQTLILAGISILVLILISIFYRQITNSGRIFQTGFGLIAGGTLGNLIDRLRFGYVVDFIDFHIWPVFNTADSAITIGVILLFWKIFRERKNESYSRKTV